MATSDPVRLLQEEVTCAVCLDYLHEPVTIDCGHNFCRACITRCWDEMGRRFPCPQCRARSPKRKLRPNCQLANVAMAAKRLRPNMGEEGGPGPGTSVGKSQEAREDQEGLPANGLQRGGPALPLPEEEAPKAPEDKTQDTQDGETETEKPPKGDAGEEDWEPKTSAENKPEEAPGGEAERPGEAEAEEAHSSQKTNSETEEAWDGRAERQPKAHREDQAKVTAEAPESEADKIPGEKAEGIRKLKARKGAPGAGQASRAGNSPVMSPGDQGQWAEPRPGMSLPRSPCPRHPGEELWLFCRRDGAALCPACHPERAHRGHDLVVLAEEGRATRAKLRGTLSRLRAQQEALEDAGARQEHQVAHLGEEAAIRRQRLGDEFEGLRHFLSKAEQDLLSSLATAERQAQAARRARGARLSANARRLDRLLLEASAWLHLPSARLLGDSNVQEGLRRLEAEAGKTLGTRVGPGEGLGGAGRAQAVLKEAARAFRERLSGELEREDPPVRFDANSAASGLEVSECGRTVRLKPRVSTQQAEFRPCVLGDQAWRNGAHYWEVDVSGSGGWAVGVACEGHPRPQPNRGLWVLQLSRGQLWSPEVKLAVQPRPQRLAVFLEVEAGLLAFSDAQSGVPVHSYQGADWGPGATLRPCFWLWDVGGSLRLSP